MYVHAYTLYSSVRPFGCSVMLGSYDDDGPQLCTIDPSGVSHVCSTFCLTFYFPFHSGSQNTRAKVRLSCSRVTLDVRSEKQNKQQRLKSRRSRSVKSAVTVVRDVMQLKFFSFVEVLSKLIFLLSFLRAR